MTESQLDALTEPLAMNCHTATAGWRIREIFRWVKNQPPLSRQEANHRFHSPCQEKLDDSPLLQPVCKTWRLSGAIGTEFWAGGFRSLECPRLEGLNSLFQAARARARGDGNTATFLSMMYLIAASIEIFIRFHTF